MTFSIFLKKDADAALRSLGPDDFTFCSTKISALGTNPYPGTGGDKEKLDGRKNLYRLHISRTYTALYRIDREKKRVCVVFFGRIGAAHKIY